MPKNKQSYSISTECLTRLELILHLRDLEEIREARGRETNILASAILTVLFYTLLQEYFPNMTPGRLYSGHLAKSDIEEKTEKLGQELQQLTWFSVLMKDEELKQQLADVEPRPQLQAYLSLLKTHLKTLYPDASEEDLLQLYDADKRPFLEVSKNFHLKNFKEMIEGVFVRSNLLRPEVLKQVISSLSNNLQDYPFYIKFISLDSKHLHILNKVTNNLDKSRLSIVTSLLNFVHSKRFFPDLITSTAIFATSYAFFRRKWPQGFLVPHLVTNEKHLALVSEDELREKVKQSERRNNEFNRAFSLIIKIALVSFFISLGMNMFYAYSPLSLLFNFALGISLGSYGLVKTHAQRNKKQLQQEIRSIEKILNEFARRNIFKFNLTENSVTNTANCVMTFNEVKLNGALFSKKESLMFFEYLFKKLGFKADTFLARNSLSIRIPIGSVAKLTLLKKLTDELLLKYLQQERDLLELSRQLYQFQIGYLIDIKLQQSFENLDIKKYYLIAIKIDSAFHPALIRCLAPLEVIEKTNDKLAVKLSQPLNEQVIKETNKILGDYFIIQTNPANDSVSLSSAPISSSALVLGEVSLLPTKIKPLPQQSTDAFATKIDESTSSVHALPPLTPKPEKLTLKAGISVATDSDNRIAQVMNPDGTMSQFFTKFLMEENEFESKVLFSGLRNTIHEHPRFGGGEGDACLKRIDLPGKKDKKKGKGKAKERDDKHYTAKDENDQTVFSPYKAKLLGKFGMYRANCYVKIDNTGKILLVFETKNVYLAHSGRK